MYLQGWQSSSMHYMGLDKVVGSPSSLLYSQHRPQADLRIKSRYMYDKSLQYSGTCTCRNCTGWFIKYDV